MENTQVGNCLVCGRYVGTIKNCPYCDAAIQVSAGIRWLRLAAVLLAVAGLPLLYLTARAREPEVVLAETISPQMNFAHIAMRGSVKSKPYIGRGKDYLSFLLDDGTGVVKVFASGKTAHILIDNNRLPTAGARMSVRGKLHVSASESALEIKLPGHLQAD